MNDYINPTMEVAKGISEYSVFVMIASVFIVSFGVILYFILKMFKQANKDNKDFLAKAFDNQQKMFESNQKMFENQQKVLESILDLQKNNNASIYQLKESLTGEVMNQVRILMKYVFTSNKDFICRTIIGHIKEKDNLEDRDAIGKKVKSMLNNLYKTMKADIDVYRYNGIKLSEYCLDEWLDRAYKYSMDAIYDGKEYHRDTYFRGLDILFEAINIEFFENLKRMA